VNDVTFLKDCIKFRRRKIPPLCELKQILANIEGPDDGSSSENLKEALPTGDRDFRQLFNSGLLPQWIYAPDSLRLLYVNSAAIQQYGYSEEEFLDMTILEITPREEIQKLILFNEFMKNTKERFSSMNHHKKKNGGSILSETTYFNITHKGLAAVLVTASDVSEKIKLDEQITLAKVVRQQKITKATITGQESERNQIGKELHDNINQLLTSAKLYLEFARTNEESRVDFIGRTEIILAKAIGEIRSLSNSLAPPTLKDIGFAASLGELFETYRATRTFAINLSIKGDPDQLKQELKITLYRIVQEQLNNILKHANAKSITLKLSIADQIGLSIADDGNGFDATIKRKGLGITNIVNRVELYSGTVRFLSKPQMGCTLLISIPNEMNNKGKGGMKILMVEDDADDREIIAGAFAEVAPQYEITYLDDGKLLVDLLTSFSDSELPSLVVLDYNMPLLNGLETLKILELDHRYNKIPKVIYSSSSANYIKNLCYAANAKAYITKGSTMDEIKGNVQEMLSVIEALK